MTDYVSEAERQADALDNIAGRLSGIETALESISDALDAFVAATL